MAAANVRRDGTGLPRAGAPNHTNVRRAGYGEPEAGAQLER
jgi:hypothetical protein